MRSSATPAAPELLADVERLRHAVIDARHEGGRGGGRDDAGDEIATLVASWSLEQAEQVARAFAVYFHLANLAEEHQRIRNLRERDTGTEPVRESLAAAVAEISHDAGPEHLRELLASLRVHLVLTAHPTEARRRAVVAALRRISGLLDVLDDQRAAAADHAEARRELREQIDLLWRTSQLRVKAMDPIDEVRTVMTAFDETLFRVVPAVYRELDRAVAETAGPGSPAPAFLRFGSWVGADRDGNPFVTAQVTRETATIQADHVLRALENATTRIGRALTLHAATTPPSAGLRRALAAAHAAHPELLAEIEARSPQEPYRTYLLFAAQRINATRVRHADLAYPGRPSSSPTCARSRSRWPRPGPSSRPAASCSTSSGRRRRSASTWPAWRSGSTARCTPGRWPNSAPPACPAPSTAPACPAPSPRRRCPR